MAFDRRQKSFGEPTRVRADGTRPEARDDDVTRPRPANTAYERYKQELAAFFNGSKPLPEHMKDMLATRPGAAEHGIEAEEAEAAEDGNEVVADCAPRSSQPGAAKRKKGDEVVEKSGDKKARRVINGPGEDVLALVDAIKRASSPREVETAVDALRAKGASLPKDAEVLSRALGHGSEEVLTEAMCGLLEVEMKDIKSPTLLKTRVKNVALLASSSELRALCAKMQQRLG